MTTDPLATAQAPTEPTEDELTDLHRDELEKVARESGIENPEDRNAYPNKAALARAVINGPPEVESEDDASEDESSGHNLPEDHAALDANGNLQPYYCPGCGKGLGYPGECRGTGAAPHAPIQTVSTDELSTPVEYDGQGRVANDPHTAAPATGE